MKHIIIAGEPENFSKELDEILSKIEPSDIISVSHSIHPFPKNGIIIYTALIVYKTNGVI